jgi:hypothetical protein
LVGAAGLRPLAGAAWAALSLTSPLPGVLQSGFWHHTLFDWVMFFVWSLVPVNQFGMKRTVRAASATKQVTELCFGHGSKMNHSVRHGIARPIPAAGIKREATTALRFLARHSKILAAGAPQS